MNCRRCGRELPVGHRKTCPFCGIYLGTYIEPRNPNARAPRKRSSRATLLSFISVGFVVAVVCVVVPFLRNVNRENDLKTLREMYELLSENEFSESEREMKIAVFSASIASFKKSYPGDTENAERLERELSILCGLDPDDPDSSPEEIDFQKLHNERLIRDAKTSIIDILSYAVSEPGQNGDCSLTVTIKNCSDKRIERVNMTFGAFDKDGKPALDTKRNASVGYVRTTKSIAAGAKENVTFLAVWNSTEVAEVRLLNMTVIYNSEEQEYFPEAVCDELWR